MKKSWIKIPKALLISLSLMMIILVSACSTSGEAGSSGTKNGSDKEVYTLKAASILDESNIFTSPLMIFKELVEEKSDGRIEIDFIGGPEAIPAFNQGEAIQNGILDISLNFVSYYADLVPEALAINYSELTYEEELEKGSWDYLKEKHESMNATTLGRVFDIQDGIYTKKKVESTADLKGLRIRGTTKYIPTLQAFGAEVMSIESGEVYSALEKGMVDGVAWAELGITDIGVVEEIEYQVFPKFNKIESIWLMNLDAYNELPEDLQTIIEDAAKEAYYESEEVLQEAQDKEQKVLEENGVESITLTDEDNFLEKAADASWDWINTKVSDSKELEKYFRK